jgi:hypothetical protein
MKRSPCWCILASLWFAVPELVAQVPRPSGVPPATGLGTIPVPSTTPRATPNAPPIEPQAPRDPLDPIWQPLAPRPSFAGFPVFPSRLQSYGSYPGGPTTTPPAGELGGLAALLGVMPKLAPEDPGWPTWLKARSRTPLPYAPNLALLVRNADRVWTRAVDDEAFVPLFHHDKLRTLTVGAEVKVPAAGEFELLLHDSGRLIASGPTELRLQTMDPTQVEVVVRTLTRLRLELAGRIHRYRLPDGSTLLVGRSIDEPPAAMLPRAPGSAEPPATTPAAPPVPVGNAIVTLERADEPGWLGGRATLFNGGTRQVVWQHAFGECFLEPGQRVVLFLSPPATPIPAALATDVATTPDGRVLQAHANEAGSLAWCGARFELPAGTSLRLDALLGEPFGGRTAEPAR